MIHPSHAFTVHHFRLHASDGTQPCVTFSFGTLAHHSVAKVIYFSLALHQKLRGKIVGEDLA